MSLILKTRHRRYTWLSVIGILPLLLTAVAVIFVLLFDLSIARQLLQFLITLDLWLLGVIWVALPIFSAVLAHQAHQRGSIDRWRSINRFTTITAQVLLGGIGVLALLSVFGISIF